MKTRRFIRLGLALLIGLLTTSTALSQTIWFGAAPQQQNIVGRDFSIPLQFSTPGVSSDPLAPLPQATISTGMSMQALFVGGIAVNRPWNIVWTTNGRASGGVYTFTSFAIPTKICGSSATTSTQQAGPSPAMGGGAPDILGITHDPEWAATQAPDQNPASHPGRLWCLYLHPAQGWSVIEYFPATQSFSGTSRQLLDVSGQPLATILPQGATVTDLAFCPETNYPAVIPEGLLYVIDSTGNGYEFIVGSSGGVTTWTNTVVFPFLKQGLPGVFYEGITVDTSRPSTLPAVSGPQWALTQATGNGTPVLKGTLLALNTQGATPTYPQNGTYVETMNNLLIARPWGFEFWQVQNQAPQTGLSVGMEYSGEYVRFGNGCGGCAGVMPGSTIDVQIFNTAVSAQPMLVYPNTSSCPPPPPGATTALTHVYDVRSCTANWPNSTYWLVRNTDPNYSVAGTPIGSGPGNPCPVYPSLVGAIITQGTLPAPPPPGASLKVSICSWLGSGFLPTDGRLTEINQWVMMCNGGQFSAFGNLETSDAIRYSWSY